MKHPEGDAPAPPSIASDVFGAALSTASAYAEMLAGAGVQRGLVGPREVPRLWERHLLNSAAVSAAVPGRAAVLDVGSGAGLPGVPLALVRPDLVITLVEPLLRRATFLHDVVAQLSLGNVTVQRARAEELAAASTDVVVARAVAPLAKLVGWTLPLVRPGGRLVAMKGQAAQDELDAAVPALRRLSARSWQVRELAVGAGIAPTRAVVVVAGSPRRQR